MFVNQGIKMLIFVERLRMMGLGGCGQNEHG